MWTPPIASAYVGSMEKVGAVSGADDVWHSGAAKGALEDLVDDVSAALDGWAVDELTMHPLRVTLARVMDDPSGALHGVVQVEAMVEG